MEQYLRRNRLSETIDAFGLAALMYLLAAGWFVWLWGLTVPSLLAGAALGTLFWLARCQWRKRSVHRREKALRSRIGAELLLESMLLSPAKEAHVQAAVLLSQKWPVLRQISTDEGVLCRQGNETLLIRCVRISPDTELSQGDLLAAQRAVRQLGAGHAVLCVLGKVSPRIMVKADESIVPIRIIRRETLVSLAGNYAPATDEQLVELGKRRKPQRGNSLLRLVFHPDKARRYHFYGLGMLIVYIISGARLYAVPGMLCLTIAVMCRIHPQGQDVL